LELQNLILDCVLTNHSVCKNVLRLPDTVSTIDGLLLHCRVPPWIHDVDVISCRKVQTDASRLQRNQEHANLIVVLETLYGSLPLWRRSAAIEVFVLDAK